jgi:hypothetical protein
MSIGNWDPGKDHCRIFTKFTIPAWVATDEKVGNPWSIEQPILRKLSQETLSLCKSKVNEALTLMLPQLLLEIKTAHNKIEAAERWSKRIARTIVQTTGSITGLKRPTHKKGKFETDILKKTTAQVSTLSKARDLIRSLSQTEFRSEQEKRELEEYLKVCLDRLVRLGVNSIPTTLNIRVLVEWSESAAIREIGAAQKYIADRKEDIVSLDKLRRKQMFLDPKRRGEWFADTYGTPTNSCPTYAIDEQSGMRTYNPEEVKNIYLREGSSFLRNKIPCLPDSKEERKPEPPPNLKVPRVPPNKKGNSLSRWWHKMYNRKAKGILATTWADLMKPVNWQEILKVILQTD